MKETPNYYAIIPANVRYDNELSDKAKLLYGEIIALSDKEGYCWATNNYFANLYDVSKMTISRLITQLANKKYIDVEIKYKENSKEIEGRYIKICVYPYIQKCIYPYIQKCIYPIYKNVKDNNINNNNININIKENIKRKVFTIPTIEEIEQYCKERNNGINANAFYDFYESKDWYVGKNKMKDWKACIRTWEQRNKKDEPKVPSWFNKDFTKQKIEVDEEIEIEDPKEIELTEVERDMFDIFN